MADDIVPQGISSKQDEIIQYVAKYVVSSCDGARYQEKIRSRTKHNSYFDFLNARHPYHHYYQYLLDSYRYHLLNSEAVNAGGWGGGDAAPHQQQQLTEEEYYQYYGAYQGQTDGIGFQTGDGDVTGGYYNDTLESGQAGDALSAQQRQQQQGAGASSVLSGVAPTAGEADATADANAEDGEGEADAEEEEYELVMENGEWVSRKRS